MLGRRWITPSWLAIALLLMAVPAFITLGFWQLQRAHEKELLLAAFAGNAEAQAIPLEVARQQVKGEVFPRVEVSGRFDLQHGYVLDNQVRGGRLGVLVFAVFEPADGSLPVLVNRGFLATAADGSRAPIPTVEAGLRILHGLYAPPPGVGMRMGGNALARQTQWPKLTVHIDLAEIGADLGRGLDSRVLLLDADAESGFEREWTPQIIPPERHLGYAFQWFCFALAALVIFIVLHWRRARSESN